MVIFHHQSHDHPAESNPEDVVEQCIYSLGDHSTYLRRFFRWVSRFFRLKVDGAMSPLKKKVDLWRGHRSPDVGISWLGHSCAAQNGLYHPQSWHGWLDTPMSPKMKWSTCLVGGDWNMAGLWLSIRIGNVIIPIDELIFFRGVGSTTNQVWCFVACTYAFSHLKLIQLADDVGCFAASLPLLPFQLRSDVGSGNLYEDEKCKKEGWSIYTEEWQWLYFCW